MKKRPCVARDWEVRAIMSGVKSQLRRPFKFQPTDYWRPDRFCVLHKLKDGHFPLRNGAPIPIGHGVVNYDGDVGYVSPFGSVGDHLWVRETWCWSKMASMQPNDRHKQFLRYRSGRYVAGEIDKWIPSIHMPRWASRITLKITDIRVQRVQEISEEDAIAEGCFGSFFPAYCVGGEITGADGEYPSDEFRKLWQSIYGTWDANPWVWAATFEVVK